MVNDCGQPMTMGSAPLFDYSVTLPNPVTVPPGEDLYIAVRGVGSGTYASRVVSAHRDLSGPQMPSYYLAPAQGFPNAVPVSTVLNCDYDFVVHPVGE